jgi:SAM-dependent methyltransferase
MITPPIATRLYLWACERLYAEFAWGYDAVAWGVSRGQWAAWRRAVLPWVQGADLLEVGFGTGVLLGELARAGYHVIGIDRSSAMQRQAARAYGAQRILGAAQFLPLPDNSFDCVVATFPAPYIGEAETLLEVARVLRPGGRLVIGGLWVIAKRPGVPVAAGPPLTLLQRLSTLLAHAGLAVAVTEALVGTAYVGILLAQKPLGRLVDGG